MSNPHQQVAERLETLRQTRCSELARLIGKSHATVSRDRESLGQWRADELLAIAAEDAELRRAILHSMVPGSSETVGRDPFLSVVEELGQMASLSKTISLAIADQRIDAREAQGILKDVYGMVAFLEETLIPSLERLRDRR